MTNADLAVVISWVALVFVSIVLLMVIRRYHRNTKVPATIVVAALLGAVLAAISGALFVTGEILWEHYSTLDISSVFRFSAIIIWSGLTLLLSNSTDYFSRVFDITGPDEVHKDEETQRVESPK